VVQVLLLDGSTFTVGPCSSLVIDKFVYNPSTGRGELVASFSKGALRFVGGKLSKTEPGVKVKTPAGALTMRGGIALMAVDGPNRTAAAIVFGDYLALARGGRLVKPGNMFVVSGPGPATTRASTAADISALLAAVSGQKTKFAGKTQKGKPWPKYYGIQPTGARRSSLQQRRDRPDPERRDESAPAHPPVRPPQGPPTRPPVIDGPGLNNLR
jgi:hypothetical protein